MVRLKMSHTDTVFTLLIDEDDDQRCICGAGIKDMFLSISYKLSLSSLDSRGFVRESSCPIDGPFPAQPHDTQLECKCGIIYRQATCYTLRWVSGDTAILTLGVSPPNDDSEPIDTTEIDEQLIEEAGQESPLSNWGFLARIARIKTMLIRVRTNAGSWCGYFAGTGSDDGMYSILKQDGSGRDMVIHYKDITSIEFLSED